MKHGYSILLGEYIEASHIEYNDCRSFQIVCPVCYEPVFKVIRNSEEKPVEYLSHYSEIKTEPEECELRVKNISSTDKDKHSADSRNQRLKYFLSVLREMIGKNPMYPKGYVKAQAQLNNSKSLEWFRDISYTQNRKQPISESEFHSIIEEYLSEITKMGGVVKTAFSLSMQKRIAFDIWNYLNSSKGRDNYNFLFNHAYLVVVCRLQKLNTVSGGLGKNEEFLAMSMIKLISANKKKGMIILSEMANTPVGQPFAIEGSNFFNKAASEVTHEMFGTLVTLPYFELLKEMILINSKNS